MKALCAGVTYLAQPAIQVDLVTSFSAFLLESGELTEELLHTILFLLVAMLAANSNNEHMYRSQGLIGRWGLKQPDCCRPIPPLPLVYYSVINSVYMKTSTILAQ